MGNLPRILRSQYLRPCESSCQASSKLAPVGLLVTDRLITWPRAPCMGPRGHQEAFWVKVTRGSSWESWALSGAAGALPGQGGLTDRVREAVTASGGVTINPGWGPGGVPLPSVF
jgi:hypothetical protein